MSQEYKTKANEGEISGMRVKHSLKNKLLVPIGILFIAIIVLLSAIAMFNLHSAYTQIINETRDTFDNNIKLTTETLVSALKANYQLYSDGAVSEEQAIETAKKIVRDTRYSSAPGKVDDGYFWADMADGLCVVHYNAANEGAMRINAQDKEGTYYVQNFIKLGDAGGGFSDFYFGKPGDEDGSHQKRGYTLKFEPYGWYISTGNYYEDTDAIISAIDAKLLFSDVILLAAGIAVAVVGMLLLSRNIDGVVKPVRAVARQIHKLSLGDIAQDFTASELREDEIGVLQNSIRELAASMRSQSDAIHAIASGDNSLEYQPRSSEDVVGHSLVTLLAMNNEIFEDLNLTTQDVAQGSQQIASAAQALAQGSTQQAAAVEQLSTTISEISIKTKENAGLASRAASLSETVHLSAEKGSEQMKEMIKAVGEINAASTNIQKVINVIDDIAFQTNILALNAAVEAARAGSAGKGFAVVAEEVRSLASKSADAAKNSSALIETSMEKAQLGTKIAEETSVSLTQIVNGINESTKIMSDIAAYSEQQSQSINQINIGIDQVAQVVQQNSATAQESAATSQELNGQSNTLEQLVGKFRLKQ